MHRIVWYGTVKSVEHRVAKRWVRGTGKDAEFEDNSIGWYMVFQEWPVAMFVGEDQPTAKINDRIKMTMEVHVEK